MLVRTASPFIDEYCREHGVDEFFAAFFDEDDNLLPTAPEELRREVDAIRNEGQAEATRSVNQYNRVEV